MFRRALLLLSLAAACESPTGLPPGAQRFTPPAVYRQWWSLTEACSGLHGDFDAVQWYVVPGESTIQVDDGAVSAVWVAKGNRIVLAAGPDGRYAGDLVRHEMLHALRQTGGHPREDFIGRCAGVVVCVTQCNAGPAAAPAPDPNAVPVEPSALEISVEVTSTPATPPDTERYVRMVVSAHNPSGEAWQVQLPPSGDAGAPTSFSYHLTNTTSGTHVFYGAQADAPEVTRFAAGETKIFIFDFWVRSGTTRYDIAAGTWTFRGAYGGKWAPTAPTLALSPRDPDDQ